MTWFTYLIGLIIFAIGAVAKFVLQLAEWQALLPLVIGLGYVTLAEGMRSTKKQKRAFIFLAILWSIVVLVSMIPMVKEGYALWTNDPARLNRPAVRLELITEHTGVMFFSAFYLVVAVVTLYRKPAQATPVAPDNSTMPSR
jgi:hypothetical protein